MARLGLMFFFGSLVLMVSSFMIFEIELPFPVILLLLGGVGVGFTMLCVAGTQALGHLARDHADGSPILKGVAWMFSSLEPLIWVGMTLLILLILFGDL